MVNKVGTCLSLSGKILDLFDQASCAQSPEAISREKSRMGSDFVFIRFVLNPKQNSTDALESASQFMIETSQNAF